MAFIFSFFQATLYSLLFKQHVDQIIYLETEQYETFPEQD